MARKNVLLAVGLPVCLLAGGKAFFNPVTTRGADERIVDERFLALEKELGYHLYAPTALPYEGRVGCLGTIRGQYRIMLDFTDREQRALAILAQERRSPQRDAYNKRIFQRNAEATAEINGARAHFVTGTSGERRLFWQQPDAALVLSSPVLSDAELLTIARNIR